MVEEVKGSRRYSSVRRQEQAAATRGAVLDSARALFLEQGYATTTVAQVARRAGVNADTVYAAVGRKAELVRAVVETAISGEDRPVPAGDRDYVRRIRAATTAGAKIDLYAAALVQMAPRTAPVFRALREAASTDPDCAALHTEITQRRAGNMRLFAADLRATGSVRPDLSNDEVADVVWVMNSSDYYLLLVEGRGWTPGQVEAHLSDAWRRLFLLR